MRKRKYLLSLLFFLCITMTGLTVCPVYASSVQEEEDNSGSKITQFWKKAIGKAEDYFLGPDVDNKEAIDDIKEIDPYNMMSSISFGEDEGTQTVKEISSSFYKLIWTVSTLGLLLSFVGGGILISWSKKRKNEIVGAVTLKVIIFIIIFSIADLYSMIVPLMKFLME